MKRFSMLILVMTMAAVTQAWVLVDDFESYDNSADTNIGATPDNLTGDVWVGNFDGTGNADIVDETSSNQSLMVTGAGNGWRGADTSTLSILDGETATVFYRFQASSTISGSGSGFDCMFGVTDSGDSVDNVDAWRDFAVMPFLSGSNDGTADLSVWDSSLGTTTLIADVALDTWYNVWLVIDNSAKTFDVYVSTGADDGVLVASGYSYRNGLGTSDLTAFGVMQGTNKGNDVLVDDVYMTDGTDVTNPVPEPATMALLAAGALLLRRKK